MGRSTLPLLVHDAALSRAVEAHAIASGLGDGALMRRAGEYAWKVLRWRWPRARRIVVVCGPGNNGGDGYVLARCALQAGCQVRVLAPGVGSGVGDAERARRAVEAAGVVVEPFSAAALAGAEVVVDALFGTGLERALEGDWAAAVRAMNQQAAPILALDLPSGQHADTGRVLGVAVVADATVSFITLKLGLLTGAGRAHAGALFYHDLDVPASAFASVDAVATRFDAASFRARRPRRRADMHKGQAGRVVVVGGGAGMPGAPVLAATAALRAGAGLVLIGTAAAHVTVAPAGVPELMAHAVDDAATCRALLDGAQAVVLGPGLGRDAWARAMFAAVLEAAPMSLVVDADGLRLLAELPQRRGSWILAPHPGEAAALLGISAAQVQADRPRATLEIARRYGGVCVLKGSGTLVAAEGAPLWVCDRGTSALASAGTGDVLAGVIAALLAQGAAAPEAARLGVYAHALAAERAAVGPGGLVAGDLNIALAEVLFGGPDER